MKKIEPLVALKLNSCKLLKLSMLLMLQLNTKPNLIVLTKTLADQVVVTERKVLWAVKLVRLTQDLWLVLNISQCMPSNGKRNSSI